MKEYIEREVGLTELCRGCSLHSAGDNFFCGSACPKYERIAAIPAADVLEVVLCRDCQNSYEWANVDGDSYRYCGYLRSRWNHDVDRMVDDDDFCKWGRKREES